MTTFLFLLIGLTLIFWILFKLRILAVCPVCAASLLSWVAGTVLLYTVWPSLNPLFIAILAGASLGAIAEKYGSRSSFVWKTFFVILGSTGLYFLFVKQPLKSAPLLITALILTLILKPKTLAHSANKEDKFKECC